ncbi:hypothetical protein BOSE127_60174 [Bosea sp. 127]|nr:hypothetical protein BOSE7B_40776 [Bosea sp. 7B]VXC84356.1 hypothetical protein BOSE127_60174 [Bosea sp. 127]
MEGWQWNVIGDYMIVMARYGGLSSAAVGRGTRLGSLR